MTQQYSVLVRDSQNDSYETTVGTAPTLYVRTGAQPVNCAAADSGTQLASGVLPSDWLAASASGVKSKLGTWTVTGESGAGAGTAGGHFRIKQGANCHAQGSFGAATAIATSALTAANSNVLNFASTTGAAVGLNITGTGIPVGATVLALTGTTVTMNLASTAGVANAASVTFKSDMVPDNNSIANLQVVTIAQYDIARGNA